MIAKPKSARVILIDGGECGGINLHPNQKWNVTFFKDNETKIGIERDNVCLILDKDFFKDGFALSL